MPNGPRERNLDHFGKPHDPSQVWLGCWLWLVEMAGKDAYWLGQFGRQDADWSKLHPGCERVEAVHGSIIMGGMAR